MPCQIITGEYTCGGFIKFPVEYDRGHSTQRREQSERKKIKWPGLAYVNVFALFFAQ
jgi:hypothetical protein